jgi:transcriptional regulator with XRE-family HTH domain
MCNAIIRIGITIGGEGMDLGSNVKRLRKDELNLTRAAFGKKLGVSADVINNIELGRLARPEQKEPLYRLICETFNVNYKWLTKGEGEMFTTAADETVDRLVDELNLSEPAEKLLRLYVELSDEQKAILNPFFRFLVDSLREAPSNANDSNYSPVKNAIEHMDALRTVQNNKTEHANELAPSKIIPLPTYKVKSVLPYVDNYDEELTSEELHALLDARIEAAKKGNVSYSTLEKQG